ncbi:MAG: cell surface protein, partial [Alphaproteobacteria bacterium]
MKICKRTAICFGIFFVLFLMTVGNAAAVQEEGTETQITTNNSRQSNPDIYEDRIVWTDWRNGDGYSSSDIYMYDLSTSSETQITTNNSNQGYPDIYGDTIVWVDERNGNLDIYMYDLSTSTETQITTNESNQGGPAIYGDRIVWLDGRNSGSVPDDGFGGFDVYMYDLSTKKETRITKSTIAANPDLGVTVDIYDNKIVWGPDMDGSNISVYDLSTGRQENVSSALQLYNIAFSGNRIVGTNNREGREGVVNMYDLSTATETKITADFSAYGGPDISGNRIVWPDFRNSDQPGELDLYMYDLSTSTEARITTSKSVAWSAPSIYGDRIVW